MAERRLAWVLNLDADLELAAREGYSPKRSVVEAMAKFVPLLAQSLLGPEDVLIDESSEPSVARALPGRAFCPTPRALALLERAGATLEPAPSIDILRRVNSRAFAASPLPSAAFVISLDAARAKLAEAPAVGNAWRIKRAFGMAGRGQRIVEPGRATAADLAAITEDGVQIEPNVTIVSEYAIHGMLGQDRALVLGDMVRQRCDAHGAWLASESIPSPSAAEFELGAQLVEEARSVAASLADAGYFGPFGIDAFTYLGVDGEVCFQPRSEINARYSMGFPQRLVSR